MAPKTILLSLLAASVVFAAGSSAGPLRTTGPADAAPPVKADQNGDKVLDTLESRLAGMSASDQLAVIVTLKAPATADRVSVLERSVGALGSAERFSIIDGIAATVTKAQVEDLSRLDVVEHVEENSQMRALNDSAQSSFGVTQARLDFPSADGNATGSRATRPPTSSRLSSTRESTRATSTSTRARSSRSPTASSIRAPRRSRSTTTTPATVHTSQPPSPGTGMLETT